ncbi:DUF6042 family protein [Streptomyces sp. MMS24-I2-30]|uniref:DUF6042 family protein n=1 Tax=Streptomyces sp. MMS24-I2-30 TaxID=3351564 RepID=UPI00389692C5
MPGPRRDMAMHNDWWVSGWEHVLPRQGFPLTMLIGTACQPGFTGSLDDLVHELFDGHWDMIGGYLDGALTFSWPDEEWDYEAAPEGREACEAARWEQFSTMLTAAGFPVPTTVRDLSELYLTWGLARREETPDGTRWSMPAALPGNDFWLVDDRLVRFNVFSGDGQAIEPDHTEDPSAVKLCAEAFRAVWDLAIPHADYRI